MFGKTLYIFRQKSVRNTLRYRLDRICEIAQLNMKDEQLKKQMILSIYCFDLFPKIQGMSHLPPRGIAAK